MKKILIFFIFIASITAKAQICDSSVPTFNIDFTGASAGTTWTSPWVGRLGYCCAAGGVDRCIDFVLTTDSNTTAVVFTFYVNPPIGAVSYQVDCGPLIVAGDTAQINTCGVHCLTMCKPGNQLVTYYVTSILAISPTACSGYSTQCNSILTLVDSPIESSSKIFPNPATTEVTINFGKASRYTVQLSNTLGEVLEQTQTKSSSLSLNLSTKPKGIYFITLTDEQGNKVVRKVVKM